MAYKGIQYTKDRDTNIDAGVKIYWRCKNRNSKYFDVIRRISTDCRSRPNDVVGETSYRPNVAFDQTSFRLNGFRPNVMDPLGGIYQSYLK